MAPPGYSLGFTPAFMKTAVNPHLLTKISLTVALILVVGGCANVPVYEQRLVSKVGMTQTDSLVQGDQVNLLSQIEPGSAISGGAVAAGCTACR